LTTPHRLAIFEGGHVWLSSDLAIAAVEWMELQAIKSGLKPRDEGEIDRLFTKRTAAIDGERNDKDRYLALRGIAEDFAGLRDVQSISTQASALGRDKAVRDALKRDDDEDDREERTVRDVMMAEARLESLDERSSALSELRRRWKDLSDASKRDTDSPERRFARRVLGSLGASAQTRDADYQKIIAEYRPPRRGQ
jgi:hypothetical protein